MRLERIESIINNDEKCDIFYQNRAVWIQELNHDIAKVGFIDNFEEKDIPIADLKEGWILNTLCPKFHITLTF